MRRWCASKHHFTCHTHAEDTLRGRRYTRGGRNPIRTRLFLPRMYRRPPYVSPTALRLTDPLERSVLPRVQVRCDIGSRRVYGPNPGLLSVTKWSIRFCALLVRERDQSEPRTVELTEDLGMLRPDLLAQSRDGEWRDGKGRDEAPLVNTLHTDGGSGFRGRSSWRTHGLHVRICKGRLIPFIRPSRMHQLPHHGRRIRFLAGRPPPQFRHLR